MDAQAANKSPLYLFEKFEVGVIHLDAKRTVLAMNDFARKVLPVGEKEPFDKLVTSFHPDRSRPKVDFLLDQASSCPMVSAVPMTMIINIPEQVLLIKVTRLADHLGKTTGFVLVFYDVTQVVSQAVPPPNPSSDQRAIDPHPHGGQPARWPSWTRARCCAWSRRPTTRGCSPATDTTFATSALATLKPGWIPLSSCGCTAVSSSTCTRSPSWGAKARKTHVVLEGKPREPIPVSRGEVVQAASSPRPYHAALSRPKPKGIPCIMGHTLIAHIAMS